MPGERPAPPIVSTRADDPAFDERIDAFVVGLGERVDHLQDAEAEGDAERLRKLAGALSREAEALGYPALAEAAQRVVTSCDEPGADVAHKHVAEVTEVARRVRRGHRSAA